MESPTIWSDSEQRALLDELIRAEACMDINNTYTMGYVVMGASKKLSRTLRREIIRTAVVEGILKLKDRLTNFSWFLTLPRVTYDEGENRASVTDQYWARVVKETWETGAYRVGGQPMYKDLKHVFLRGKADVADFDWLHKSFDEDEWVCLSGEQPWPSHNSAMAVYY